MIYLQMITICGSNKNNNSLIDKICSKIDQVIDWLKQRIFQNGGDYICENCSTKYAAQRGNLGGQMIKYIQTTTKCAIQIRKSASGA